MNRSYNAETIQVLEGWEAIRKRPRMYIGSTDRRGIRRLLWELVYNSTEEVVAGYANQINVDLNFDSSFTVTDNGRGISTDIHPQTEKSFLESVMTKMYARGFCGNDRYKVRGGWNGFGLAVVNALSEWVEVTVWRDKKVYSQKYKRGIALTKLQVKPGHKDRTGTAFVFKPDPDIFGTDNQLDETALALRLQQLAYLNAGAKITLTDRRVEPIRVDRYQYFNGIRGYLEAINRDRQPLHEVIYVAGERDQIKFEVALQWCAKRDVDYMLESFPCAALLGQKLEGELEPEQFDAIYLLSFANQVQTIHGGTHVAGVKSAIIRTINAMADCQNKVADYEPNLSWFQLRKGLTGIISVMLLEPEYNYADPARWELTNIDVENIISEVVGEAIANFLESHPSMAKDLSRHFFQSLPN